MALISLFWYTKMAAVTSLQAIRSDHFIKRVSCILKSSDLFMPFTDKNVCKDIQIPLPH